MTSPSLFNKRKCEYSGYEGTPSKIYSIVASISENSLELAAISKRNTNGAVLTEFIDELAKKLVEKYGERCLF